MTQISANGTRFIAAHEGFASKAYLCPAGVVTIGYGFTNGSKIVAEWWQARHGRPLKMGDTIDRSAADSLLQALLNHEYGAAVSIKLGSQPQHRWDGATSTAFNCGTGSLNWKWARALAAGDVAGAAALLRTTATTANGRQLPGLVRRRKDEARLIETGNYGPGVAPGHVPPSASTLPADTEWFRAKLKSLGYDVTDLEAAVRKFQKDNALVVDGIVGPATRATIIRRLDGKTAGKTTAGGGVVGGPTGGTGQPDPSTITDETALYIALGVVIGCLVIGGLYWLYRNRGRFTGQRVPT
jgi:lysozyme